MAQARNVDNKEKIIFFEIFLAYKFGLFSYRLANSFCPKSSLKNFSTKNSGPSGPFYVLIH